MNVVDDAERVLTIAMLLPQDASKGERVTTMLPPGAVRREEMQCRGKWTRCCSIEAAAIQGGAGVGRSQPEARQAGPVAKEGRQRSSKATPRFFRLTLTTNTATKATEMDRIRLHICRKQPASRAVARC